MTTQRMLMFLTLAAMATIEIPAAVADAGSAAALQATHARLRPALDHSPFGKPLMLVSSQNNNRVEGNIDAVLDQPFERVRGGLGTINSWCDLLILHPNVTNCRLNGGNELTIYLGKSETAVSFTYEAVAASADYVHVRLHAERGPAGTSDYRVVVEAAPLDPQHTLLRLEYSHAYGLQARIAMRAYLSTFGRGKVGFTVVDRAPAGSAVYIGDVRGTLERNAMRYFICVETYVASLAEPPAQQLEHRLRAWYAYTQRYPLQLREDDGYLDAKRRIARNVS